MAKRVTVMERIEKFANDYGYSFRDDYSGRCMFGKRCIGVTGSRYMDTELFEFLVNEGMSTSRARVIVKEASWDNMGLDMIMYFPNRQ